MQKALTVNFTSLLCDEVTEVFSDLDILRSTNKNKEVLPVNIMFDKKLKDYMENKGHKDIVLDVTMCNS